MRLAAILSGVAIALAAPVSANPESIAPSGWKRTDQSNLVVYRAASGEEVMVFRTLDRDSDPAASVQELTDAMTGKAAMVAESPARTIGIVHVQDVEYSQRNIRMKGRISAVRKGDGSVLVLAHLAPKSAAGLVGRMDQAVAKMGALASPGGAAQVARSPLPKASDPQPVAPTKRGQSAQKVLFELKYSYGVGGAVYPTYHLVALLEGGTAAKLGSYAVDDVDVSAIRRKKSSDVGTWRNSGRNVQVRWADGDTSELKPNVGPPTALPAARLLPGTYQAVGGGGNTALGGQVLTAQVKQFTFLSNGTFSQSSNKSASSSAAVARARSGNAGRWELDGATLTLTYGDGRVVRTSVFYSGSAKPKGKFGRYGVLWIGGEDYKRVR